LIAKDIAGRTYRRCHACGIATDLQEAITMVRSRFYPVPEAAQFHAAVPQPSEKKLSARVAAD